MIKLDNITVKMGQKAVLENISADFQKPPAG